MAAHVLELGVFGGRSRILVDGPAPDGTQPQLAAIRAAAVLRRTHALLTRFDPASALSRLNADPHAAVRTHPWVAELAAAVRHAGELSGGLVDGTLLAELEAAGYHATLDELPGARPTLPDDADPDADRPAGPHPAARWRLVEGLPGAEATVVRPPGVLLDGGGLVKGLACDRLARMLAAHPRFAVDCSGDVRVGGTAREVQEVRVAAAFGTGTIATLRLAAGAVATSGTTRRRFGDDGAHHLLDPATGAPARTGIVQVTARAATGLEAEVRAKSALLAGPAGARAFLPEGGLLVRSDGRVELVDDASVREAVAA